MSIQLHLLTFLKFSSCIRGVMWKLKIHDVQIYPAELELDEPFLVN